MPTEQTTEQSTQEQGQKPDGQQQQTGKPDGQQQQQQTQTQGEQVQRPGAGQNPGDAQQRGLIADLQKERQARQKLERDIQGLQGHLDAERRRVQALAGVTPQTDEDRELDAIRERIVKLFPVLGKLTPEQVDEFMQLRGSAASIEEATQHHWTAHGRQMLGSLYDNVAKEVGSDLTDRQKKALGQAYVAAAEADPEFLARHETGDPKLIEEFAKQWVEDWFEPARKAVVQTETSRFRRVPSGRDRNVQTTPPKPIDFKNPKAVEDAMVESFKRHGGGFDN